MIGMLLDKDAIRELLHAFKGDMALVLTPPA